MAAECTIRSVDRLRRRPGLGIVGLLLLILLVFVGAALARAVSLRDDARTAMTHLEEAAAIVGGRGFALGLQDARNAAGEISLADASLARATATLDGDPVVALARVIPGLGGQLNGADTLVRAARLITSRHTDIQRLLEGYAQAQSEPSGP